MVELIKNIANNASTSKQLFLNFFAVIVFLSFMIFIFCITFIEIPEANQRFADTALGFILASGIHVVMAWAFRTSKGELVKKEMKEEKEEEGKTVYGIR
jgi:hypothetical protein